MPRMDSGVDDGHPTMAAAFQAALVRQGLVVLLVFAVLGLAWLGRLAWGGGSARRPAAGAGTARTPDPVRPAGRGGLPGLDPRSRGAPGPGLSRPGGGRTGAPGALRVAARARRPPFGIIVPAAAARPGRQSSSSQAGRRRAAGGIIRGW
jgi:hypothetical protein